MKGFGIEIKNNLLDPKHVEAMGSAVWLYMWLIDHMTIITETGKGIVLGGKPIKYPEIKKELGISQDTYTRWVDKLSSYPYIEIIRTPYGITFKVLKAFKRFRKSAESTSVIVRNHLRENAESNKTMTVDNTIDLIPLREDLKNSNQKLFSDFKEITNRSPNDAPRERQRYPRLIRQKYGFDVSCAAMKWAWGLHNKQGLFYWRGSLNLAKLYHRIIPDYLKQIDQSKNQNRYSEMKKVAFGKMENVEIEN